MFAEYFRCPRAKAPQATCPESRADTECRTSWRNLPPPRGRLARQHSARLSVSLALHSCVAELSDGECFCGKAHTRSRKGLAPELCRDNLRSSRAGHHAFEHQSDQAIPSPYRLRRHCLLRVALDKL